MKRREFTRAALAAASLGAGSPAALATVYSGRTTIAGDVPALTLAGKPQTLSQARVQTLADTLRAPLLTRDSEGYDLARQVLNPLIDKHPALIAQPTGSADVCTAVRFAAENDLEVAIKCGGHSFAGKSTCEGGLQIDLSRFRGVRVEPGERVAYVAGGSLLGQMDHETMALGLVTTAGTVSHTGVGGLTTGGGFGRLARRFGLALDNVVGAAVVTPDGELRYTDADHEPDLWWAIRGAGSNFGVVTTFKFRLHPMQRQVLGGSLMYPIDRAQDMLGAWAEYAPVAPDELYMDPIVAYPPGGKPGVALLDICYSGDPARTEQSLKPLRALGKPMRDGLEPMDYVALQRRSDRSDPRARSQYVRGGYVNALDDRLVRAVLDGLEPDPDRGSSIYFQHAGGAISRVAEDAAAFPHRRAMANMLPMASYLPTADVERHKRYVKQYWKTLEPLSQGFYTNEADDQTAAEFNLNYLANYPRLQTLKQRYDPDNRFRLNANIT